MYFRKRGFKQSSVIFYAIFDASFLIAEGRVFVTFCFDLISYFDVIKNQERDRFWFCSEQMLGKPPYHLSQEQQLCGSIIFYALFTALSDRK